MADLVYILLSVAFFATVALVARRADSRTPPGALGHLLEPTVELVASPDLGHTQR